MGYLSITQAEKTRLYNLEVPQKRQAARQDYVEKHPDLAPRIRDAILRGDVVAGMDSDQVLASWQDPNWQIVQTTQAGSDSIEDWKHNHTYVTFQNGVVTMVSYIPE